MLGHVFDQHVPIRLFQGGAGEHGPAARFPLPGELGQKLQPRPAVGIAERLARARKTLEEVESPDYLKKLSGTLGAEPVENYL